SEMLSNATKESPREARLAPPPVNQWLIIQQLLFGLIDFLAQARKKLQAIVNRPGLAIAGVEKVAAKLREALVQLGLHALLEGIQRFERGAGADVLQFLAQRQLPVQEVTAELGLIHLLRIDAVQAQQIGGPAQ